MLGRDFRNSKNLGILKDKAPESSGCSKTVLKESLQL